MSLIKKNYIYNLLMNFSSLLIPLVTFPYVTRVLGPESIGKVNFANSIVEFFTLFFHFGIYPYGVRELSKVRDNQVLFNKRFSELVIINTFLVFSLLILFVITVELFDKFKSERLLFYVVGLNIIIFTLGFDWLFISRENYSYVSIRMIITRLIGVVLLLLLVTKEQDYILYAFLSLFIGGLVSYLINPFFYRRYASLYLSDIDLLQHIKPLVLTLIVSFLTRAYLNLDVTTLGFLSNYESVGFYVVGLKIVLLFQSLVLSFSSVIAPRIAYYSESMNKEEIRNFVRKSIEFAWFLSAPILFGILILSREVVVVVSGMDFISSVPVLIIISGIFITTPILSVLSQYLYYTGGEKKYIKFVVTPTIIISLILYAILIPSYNYIGAAIARIISEIVHFWLYVISTKEVGLKNIFSVRSLKYLGIGLIMFVVLLLFGKLVIIDSPLIKIITYTTIGGVIYFGVNLITRDYFAMEVIKFAHSLIFRRSL
ncbi:MAG: oligosaccharide flippase family protein [Brevinematales bacterium]|nr:oligosaccharide flippase family protein [Brevinematales bacterium]